MAGKGAATGLFVQTQTRGLEMITFLFAPNGAAQPDKPTINTLNGGAVRGLDMSQTNPVDRQGVGDFKVHLGRKYRKLVGWDINGTDAAGNVEGDIDWANTDPTNSTDPVVRFKLKVRSTGAANDPAAGANTLVSVSLTFLTLDRG